MDQKAELWIFAVERARNDVIVTFADETSVLYPASLLRSGLPQAQLIPDQHEELDS